MSKKWQDPRVADLQKLISSKWWDIVAGSLLEKLEKLEESILDNVIHDFNEVKYTQWDMEKTKRAYFKLLLEYPEKLMAEMATIDDQEEDELGKQLLDKAVIEEFSA